MKFNEIHDTASTPTTVQPCAHQSAAEHCLEASDRLLKHPPLAITAKRSGGETRPARRSFRWRCFAVRSAIRLLRVPELAGGDKRCEVSGRSPLSRAWCAVACARACRKCLDDEKAERADGDRGTIVCAPLKDPQGSFLKDACGSLLYISPYSRMHSLCILHIANASASREISRDGREGEDDEKTIRKSVPALLPHFSGAPKRSIREEWFVY